MEPSNKKGLEKMKQDVYKQEVVLELPEELKCLMKERNDLYKMGHHSEALVKYALCVEWLWPGRSSLPCVKVILPSSFKQEGN